MYFLDIDTWNTLCTLEREGGRASLYATGPILLSILKDPMNRGLILPLYPNLKTHFIGATGILGSLFRTLCSYALHQHSFSV